MQNHGIQSLHGIDAMCDPSHKDPSRFGRLFPDLSTLDTPDEELRKLGAAEGPMDTGAAVQTANMPAGFIFLGQFIDHDITLDVTSSLDRVNDPNAIQNFRTPSFDLDCIYGSGPEATPYLYKKGSGGKLLTGRDGSCAPGQPINLRNGDLTRNIEGVALIGDPRNDENRIISQLQLAFINFHNAVLEAVQDGAYETHRLKDEDDNPIEDDFHFAQRIVRWHYQWIVIHDFLPKMVGAHVVSDILTNERQFYKPAHRAFIPIEFAAAAYRYGHSMVPQAVRTKTDQTNPLPLFDPRSRGLGRGFEPVMSTSAIVDWELFFDIDPDVDYNKADKLDTKLASLLLALPFITEGEASLATRNLLRGKSFMLPSGEAVAEALGRPQVEIDRVTDFVNVAAGPEIDLSAGTPLWFYFLAEAEVIGREDAADVFSPGEGLGPAGARIVGEVLIGLAELDSTSYIANDVNWQPFLNGNGPFTMSELLTYEPVVVS